MRMRSCFAALLRVKEMTHQGSAKGIFSRVIDSPEHSLEMWSVWHPNQLAFCLSQLKMKDKILLIHVILHPAVHVQVHQFIF